MNSKPDLLPHRTRCMVASLQVGGVLLAALAVAGCGRRPIIVQAPPATVIQAPAPAAPTSTGRDVIIVKEAPPAPREETPPPPPSSQYTWVAGYWTSRDGRQEWVPGRWEMPPRTGASWVAPRWERRSDGWVLIEGYWR